VGNKAPNKILDQRVEMTRLHTHAGMSCLHILAFALARTAARLTDLVHLLSLEAREALGIRRGRSEKRIDSLVRSDARYEPIDNGRYGGLAP
jgi:hypothetical protein